MSWASILLLNACNLLILCCEAIFAAISDYIATDVVAAKTPANSGFQKNEVAVLIISKSDPFSFRIGLGDSGLTLNAELFAGLVLIAPLLFAVLLLEILELRLRSLLVR